MKWSTYDNQFKFIDEKGKVEFSGGDTIVKVRLGCDWRRTCSRCGGTQLIELRQTYDGVVRDQPYCSKCRHIKKEDDTMGTKNDPGKYDCYAKAKPDEPVFVLLGRDPCAAFLVALWADISRTMGTPSEKCDEAEHHARASFEYWEKRSGLSPEKVVQTGNDIITALECILLEKRTP